MVATSLLTTLLLALAVAAQPTAVKTPSATLPFVKRFTTPGPQNIAKSDQLRIKGLLAIAESLIAGVEGIVEGLIHDEAGVNSPAENQAVNYVASVGVGSPPTQFDLIIDTGSSNTWLGANKKYVVTSTSHKTPNNVSVSYGSGNFNGTEFIDQVTITPDLVIDQQSIGVAFESAGFPTADGIIGIGPTNLTVGTLDPDTKASIPTVTDNLFKSGAIPERLIGVSFEPITNSSGTEMNGELTWGGTDATKFTGDITFAPITSVKPASAFWGCDMAIAYGETSLLPAGTPGIIDTGTTLVQIASDAFQVYQKDTGAVLDPATGLLRITESQYANLKSMFFTLEKTKFEFTRNAQIWPRNLNTLIGGTTDSIYLIVSDIGSKSGAGLDFIFGQTGLERFYSVYDTTNQRVGLATTTFTLATTN